MPPRTRSQTGVSPFLRLSSEIQLTILHHLIPSPKSIHALCKTCKHLYDIALPLSVHTFRNLDTGECFDENNEGAASKTIKFLRYITLTKPHLAQHVRCLILGDFDIGSPDDFPDDVNKTGALQGDEMDVYRDFINETFTRDDSVNWKIWRTEWLEGLANRVRDAEVALLLVACPNIESILMGESYKPHSFQRVIDVAADRSLINSGSDVAMRT